MSEEQNNSQEEQVVEEQEAPQSESNEMIEIEWEAVRETFEIRQEQLRIQDYVSKFLLETERQKAELLSRLAILESRVYETAGALREHVGVDESVAYELKLPEVPEEKGYFIRKQ